MQESFIKLDKLIQKIPDKQLQQDCILAMIDIMNELARPELEQYFNQVLKEPDC